MRSQNPNPARADVAVKFSCRTYPAADRRIVVEVGGDVDPASAPRLEAELIAAGNDSPDLVVDLTGTTFMDSAGLTALVAARQHVRAAGGSVVLVGPSPMVRRILTITGLHQTFTVCDTLAEALA